MLFNSGAFLKFFAAFVLLHFCLRGSRTARNALIVLGSYFFYAWWTPADSGRAVDGAPVSLLWSAFWQLRFLGLLIFTSGLDFLIALLLDRSGSALHRRWLLLASVAANLGVLGFFKYYDFFAGSLGELSRQLGWALEPASLSLVLPAGISFYTFQSMSYTIDVYRREIPATRSLVEFLAFVSFFPQLVAGPIERARHLLPQFGRTLRVTAAMLEEGFWLGVWGLFKKVVLADNLAPLVEMVFEHPAPGGPAVALATFAFGIQIYCDFSGYTDIARGLAKWCGFDLMLNFNLPYTATNLRDFWRRWHISLSTWLRDYLYRSLGGNRHGSARTLLNLFLTMLLGGLWHGAAWNFVLWGAWHGLGLVAHRIFAKDPSPPAGGRARLTGWLGTMLFVFYGWLLFRAGSWSRAGELTCAFFDLSLPAWFGNYALAVAVFSLPLVLVQVWQARSQDLLAPLRLSAAGRGALHGLMILAILIFWKKDQTPFIYFQF